VKCCKKKYVRCRLKKNSRKILRNNMLDLSLSNFLVLNKKERGRKEIMYSAQIVKTNDLFVVVYASRCLGYMIIF